MSKRISETCEKCPERLRKEQLELTSNVKSERIAVLEKERDEYGDIIFGLIDSIEFYQAQEENFEPIDEYRTMMYPHWKKANDVFPTIKARRIRKAKQALKESDK